MLPCESNAAHEVLAACLEDPQLAAEVLEFLADQKRFDQLARPLRPERAQALAVGGSLATSATRLEPPVAEVARLPPPADMLPADPASGRIRSFGEYELLAEVARGGMGIVYKARQKGLNRLVALKMILAGAQAGQDHLQRFRTEAEAAARLRHPNLVAVHEVGEIDGQPYFSMEFIDGQSLAQSVWSLPDRSQAGLPPRICTIARAVHYAHLKGILHRDLKPSNIMVDQGDEPFVTDFGLAKRLDAGDSTL